MVASSGFSGVWGKNLVCCPKNIVQAQLSDQRRLIILCRKMSVYFFGVKKLHTTNNRRKAKRPLA
jgi:hypothetical protein